jgi:hypothetical protein
MRVIALLLSSRYQLFSEATQRKIVGTEGTIKVILPEYQVYKSFIYSYLMGVDAIDQSICAEVLGMTKCSIA